MAQHILQKEDVCLHTPDLELIQGALHLLDCVDVAVGPYDDLQIMMLSLQHWSH